MRSAGILKLESHTASDVDASCGTEDVQCSLQYHSH